MLTLAVAQPVTAVGDVATNAEAHAAVVRAAGARLLVFPELSLTGYELDAPSVEPTSELLAPLVDACAAAGSVALVGAPVVMGDDRYIGTIAVDGRGASVAYRKMSLGGDEAARFTPGSAPAAFELDDWRIGLGICKDTRIAAHLDATFQLGIDLYVAGLVHHDHERDELEERAVRIARRGEIPVAFASAAGDVGGPYRSGAGASAIWSAHGRLLARASDGVGDVVVAELDSDW